MEKITAEIVKKLYLPPKNSHKGQNGKLTIIGGSKLFHGASLWALKIASRIVDMVFYTSTIENVALTQDFNKKLYDFISVSMEEALNYIEESDAVLIGPGMARAAGDLSKCEYIMKDIKEIKDIENEGILTYHLTKYLFKKYPQKKWIIDAGALQMMDSEWLKPLKQVVITPHLKEFINLFNIAGNTCRSEHKRRTSAVIDPSPAERDQDDEKRCSLVSQKAKEYNCVIVLKGPTDIVCSPTNCLINKTGNEGMTKGGTGDVLAGLIAGLACKNDLFLAACAGVYINGLAGDELYKTVGPYFNASDLCDQIPKTMWKLIQLLSS